MSRLRRLPLCALTIITVSAAFTNAGAAHATGGSKLTVSAPDGFEALSAERDVVLDVYYGGRKLGDVQATIKPGFVRLKDPAALVSLIPDAAAAIEIRSFLDRPLAANSAFACSRQVPDGCGQLPAGQYGVILDEDRFRQGLRRCNARRLLFLEGYQQRIGHVRGGRVKPQHCSHEDMQDDAQRDENRQSSAGVPER